MRSWWSSVSRRYPNYPPIAAIPTAHCLRSAIESGSRAMNELLTSRPIVVGIDGSKAAIRAALWAVDEAVSRDVPLRLLYVVEQCDPQAAEPDAMARKLATAETLVRRAFTAIEATGHAVKIETEIAK